jgi:hypothetical protein
MRREPLMSVPASETLRLRVQILGPLRGLA